MNKLNINIIMEKCLNISTDKLKKLELNKVTDYNFTFLNGIDLNEYNIYYDILNSYEEYKLKNIYKFIYDRILKLHKLYNIDELIKIDIMRKIEYYELNELLDSYINKDIIKSIIIINSLQQYFYPINS